MTSPTVRKARGLAQSRQRQTASETKTRETKAERGRKLRRRTSKTVRTVKVARKGRKQQIPKACVQEREESSKHPMAVCQESDQHPRPGCINGKNASRYATSEGQTDRRTESPRTTHRSFLGFVMQHKETVHVLFQPCADKASTFHGSSPVSLSCRTWHGKQ